MGFTFNGSLGVQPYQGVVGESVLGKLTISKLVGLEALANSALSAPTNFKTESRTESSVIVSWTNNHGASATGVEIHRALGTGGSFSLIATADPTDLFYLDSGLATGTLYRYKLRTVDT